ncbi:Yqey-like protein-domain-containing protein [Circinella umbellata]|nr:Yqey-like protein-domain-containing protein [Circinella umbellata]
MFRQLVTTRVITQGFLARTYTTEASGSLLARLKDDRKTFMRSKQQPDLNVVKNILSDYTYHIKSPNAPANQSEEEAVLSVIQKLVKKRQDAIAQFTAGNRPELAAQEQGELQVLKSYLPEQMSAEQVEQKVKEIVEKVGATTMKDMGKVMKAWTDASADKKMVSDAVKKLLGQ